jgi:hypothetical protein
VSGLPPEAPDQACEQGPHARPLFRVFAGLFALMAALIPATVLWALFRGDPLPDTSAFGNAIEVLAFALMTGVFAAVAITGRVPCWLFRLWTRVS